MKMCLSEGMKRIKELEKRKEALLFNETRRMCVSYREGETPAAADYDYAATRAAVSKIDDEVRAIRTAISRANCTAEAEEGCTIGEALVLVAQDLSEKTRKNMRFEADRAGAALLETAFTMEDIAAAIGKKAGVLAVCDAGFAEKLKQELGAVSEERAHALHASEKDR